MVKKILFLVILIFGFGFAIGAGKENTPEQYAKLYFVDAEMMRLLPTYVTIPENTPQKEAEDLLSSLIEGDDDNRSICRIIPKIKNGMTVAVQNDIAIVDIKEELIKEHEDSRIAELLTVYSVVNTLTSLSDIHIVQFTINGKEQKDFMGYIDMRESFVPDEYV